MLEYPHAIALQLAAKCCRDSQYLIGPTFGRSSPRQIRQANAVPAGFHHGQPDASRCAPPEGSSRDVIKPDGTVHFCHDWGRQRHTATRQRHLRSLSLPFQGRSSHTSPHHTRRGSYGVPEHWESEARRDARRKRATCRDDRTAPWRAGKRKDHTVHADCCALREHARLHCILPVAGITCICCSGEDALGISVCSPSSRNRSLKSQ